MTRILFASLLTTAFSMIPAEFCLAAITIDVGNHVIQPAAGQRIELNVSSLGSDPLVTGFNLRAQLGDGTTGGINEPTFAPVDLTGSIWEGSDATTKTGGPLAGNEQFLQWSIVFENTGVERSAAGLVIALLIDAEGFAPGETFPLKLADTEIGANSVFIGAGGVDIVPVITSGSVQIVPEPASIGIAAIGAVAFLIRRRLA